MATDLIYFVEFLFCFDEDCFVLFDRFDEHIILSFSPSAHLYHAPFRLGSCQREYRKQNQSDLASELRLAQTLLEAYFIVAFYQPDAQRGRNKVLRRALHSLNDIPPIDYSLDMRCNCRVRSCLKHEINLPFYQGLAARSEER